MATATNSLVPGTGAEIGNLQAGAGVAASMPGQSSTALPSPTTAINPTATAQTNPYSAPTSTGVPQTSPLPTAVASNGVTFNTGDKSVTGDFQQTYGYGTGTALAGALSGLGTSTDTAVAATTNATNTAANQQYANIQAQQAAAGITPNSSAAALAAGDFYSNVNSSLQSTIGNMELNEEGTLINSLTNEGSAHGSDQSGWDTFGDVIGDIADVGTFGISGAIAGAFGSGGSGSSGGSSSDISGMLADMG